MKQALAKALAVVAITAIGSGFTYAHCQAQARHEAMYKTVTYTHTVQPGETLDEIFGDKFDMKAEGCSWMEWRATQRSYNIHLTKNGRSLQIGDEVVIKVKERK